MKVVYVILLVAVIILTVVFAAQNSATVTVAMFSWSATQSLSLLLIIALALGFILGLLVMTPSVYKRGRLSARLKKKVTKLEKGKEGGNDAAIEPAAPLPEKGDRTTGKQDGQGT